MNTLAQLAETVRNLFHIQCTFRCPEPVVVENDKVSEQLFHITQEAVDNARKHGDAERVTISLRNTPGGLTLTIRDNGVGIPGEMSNQGLEIMNYRAAEIGATLSVHRADKSGTLVTCRLVFG
jgi:signal transduction histidine kinase